MGPFMYSASQAGLELMTAMTERLALDASANIRSYISQRYWDGSVSTGSNSDQAMVILIHPVPRPARLGRLLAKKALFTHIPKGPLAVPLQGVVVSAVLPSA